MKDHYPVFILWSEDDECFLANVVDLPGCIADGRTREEAMKNAEAMASDWVQTAKSLGRKIPKASTNEDFEATAAKQQQMDQEAFEAAVKAAALEIVKVLIPKLEARYLPKPTRGIFPHHSSRISIPA
jgi:predicted RNase H-like HicB family nuclease